MIDIDGLFNFICSRRKGATKKEINKIALMFGYEIKPYEWRRIHYALARRSGCLDIYCENKKWFCFRSYYYKNIVEFVNNNTKEKTYMGMAMGGVPFWIQENYELFNKVFKLEDF